MASRNQFKSKEEYNAWFKEYRKSDKWKKYHTEYNRQWRKKNGIKKDMIRKKVCLAIKSGKLKREPCKICGKIEVEGHHLDYSKPLEIIWLCREHHREADVKLGVRSF